MEKIVDFESVLYALENDQMVVINVPVFTRFILKEDKVRVKTENAQYTLNIQEFTNLYKYSIFYHYEHKQSAEIEAQKDEEYYAFKHK